MSIERGLLSVAIWQKYCISRLSRRTMVQAKQKRNSSKGNSKMYLQYRVQVRIQLNNYVYLKDQRQHREGVWRLYRRSDRCDRASAVGRKRKPGSRLPNAPRSGPVRSGGLERSSGSGETWRDRRVEVNDSCDSTERTWRHSRMLERSTSLERRWCLTATTSEVTEAIRHQNDASTCQLRDDMGQLTSCASHLTLTTALAIIVIGL